ncbi:MAG: hypothetical protein R3F56_06970 [Planctomycetota bacterium]
MLTDQEDVGLRLAAFRHLNELKRRHGPSLRRGVLEEGFEFDGRRVRLVGPQGIFTPVGVQLPLSITTAPLKRGKERPYDDRFGADGFLHYRYRGTDPQHRDKVGLRRAMSERRPLIYFHGTVSPRYVLVFPVFVVGDDPAALAFTLQVDVRDLGSIAAHMVAETIAPDLALLRRYRTVEAQQPLHQELFRDQVLDAYRVRCSVCQLRPGEEHTRRVQVGELFPPTTRLVRKRGQ